MLLCLDDHVFGVRVSWRSMEFSRMPLALHS
jgi:hypothetical protein